MTRLRRSPIPPLLIAWVALGVVRLLFGSSTSLAAYFFFGLLWLASAALLVAAIRQLVVSKMREERIEEIAVCGALASLFAQGLLGSGHTIAFAAIAFLASVIVLLFIYSRRLRPNPVVAEMWNPRLYALIFCVGFLARASCRGALRLDRGRRTTWQKSGLLDQRDTGLTVGASTK